MSEINRNNVKKIYCEKCDLVLNSKKEFDKHLENHNQIRCEECPLDTLASKITRLFKRN